MSNTCAIKQGDDFAITWTWTPGESGPADLTETTVSSTIRVCRDELPLTVTVAEDGLTFTIAYDGLTDDWKVGEWPFDILFEFPSGKTHSETFRCKVGESIT